MSRIGKHPVPIPAGVTVSIEGVWVQAKGPKGSLSVMLTDDVTLTQEGNAIAVRPRDDGLKARMMWGTARTLVSNLVNGVEKGFSRKLDISGVGYKAQVQGTTLVLALGYSHDIRYPMPEGIKIECPDPTHITISGANKQLVGQVAAEIRAYRPVEPYKAKGIKYEKEYVIRKEGKKK